MFNFNTMLMSFLKINFEDSNEIQFLIDMSYDSLGKIKNETTRIRLSSDNVNYKILSGMDHYESVKVLNNLIEGSMLCYFEEKEDYIELIPKSNYCIKKKEKYTFY